MSTTHVLTETKSEQQDFFDSLDGKNVAPLWAVMSKMVPPNPKPQASPWMWQYKEIKPALLKSGEIVDAKEAERRVLMLVNPSMKAPYTTDTIYGGLQLILPGEVAPAHRHVAFAVRFIIEGSDGFTAVEGQKITMEKGDVILTPSWHWHDHGNEGAGPMIWLDGLDLPLFQNVPVNFAENYAEDRYPSTPVSTSPLRIPWSTVQSALDNSPGSHATYHYSREDESSGHLSNSISAQAERIDHNATTIGHRETCSFIYHIKSGRGHTIIKTQAGEEKTFEWQENDTFAVPAWSAVQHVNTGAETAYLFALNDRPMVESLGLFRKQ